MNIITNKLLKLDVNKSKGKNKGTGAGGKNTNINGIKFENITDNEPFLLQNNFNKVKINKKYYYLIKKSDNTNILWFKQHAFIKYITILKYITI